MGVMYFKRFRMEIALRGRDFSHDSLPEGYRLVPWQASLLNAHAEAKYLAFRSEIDSNVFPCLGELAGCLRLMTEISRKEGFLPHATWLLVNESGPHPQYCGTVQGVRDRSGMGAIQNLGIAPGHRDRGLGAALLSRSLEGFRQCDIQRVFLEVTARNEGAIRLYRRLGFARARTVYKAVEVATV